MLIHIIDVSGNTNEKGEATSGYNPIHDVEWLRAEIHNWIFNNIWAKWPSVVRRHVAVAATPVESLHAMLSGYRCTPAVVGTVLDRLAIKEPLESARFPPMLTFVPALHGVASVVACACCRV